MGPAGFGADVTMIWGKVVRRLNQIELALVRVVVVGDVLVFDVDLGGNLPCSSPCRQ